ncbi:response regulator [Patescibacteria group bacterium]|nr:response regulator [Patescibacteria group bacterium]
MSEEKINTEVKQKTILLVEDDVFLSNLLMSRLQKAGLKVVKAMTGEEAISILKTDNEPDLILLDIILPEMTGFEVLKQIQEDPTLGKSPVIIASNLGQSTDIERGKQFGVVNYFIKAQTPIDKLVEEVKRVVGK